MAKRNTTVPTPTDALGALLRGERPAGVKGASVDARGTVELWPGSTVTDLFWMMQGEPGRQVAEAARRRAVSRRASTADVDERIRSLLLEGKSVARVLRHSDVRGQRSESTIRRMQRGLRASGALAASRRKSASH